MLKENIVKLTRSKLRKIINEEVLLAENEDRVSEIKQFSRTRSGKNVRREGTRIKAAGESIAKEIDQQTGRMQETVRIISEFVTDVGEALEGIGMLNEGDMSSDKLPSSADLKRLYKEIQKLER